jgi:hypothetical protein
MKNTIRENVQWATECKGEICDKDEYGSTVFEGIFVGQMLRLTRWSILLRRQTRLHIPRATFVNLDGKVVQLTSRTFRLRLLHELLLLFRRPDRDTHSPGPLGNHIHIINLLGQGDVGKSPCRLYSFAAELHNSCITSARGNERRYCTGMEHRPVESQVFATPTSR